MTALGISLHMTTIQVAHSRPTRLLGAPRQDKQAIKLEPRAALEPGNRQLPLKHETGERSDR